MEPAVKIQYQYNKFLNIGRWCLKYILVPLFTVTIGGIIAIYSGLNTIVNFDIISPTLLSFVMVMILFSVITQTRNLTNKDNARDICLISIFPLGFFFSTFTLSAMYSNSNLINLNKIMNLLNLNTQNSSIILQNSAFDQLQFITQNVNANLAIIDEIRAGVLLFSGLTILAIIALRCACDDLEGSCSNES
jgi:hypothetical protein